MASSGAIGRAVAWGSTGTRIALACAAVTALGALLPVASASAADITVTSNLDDGTGCTLREAIVSANTGTADGCASGDFSGTDRIIFDPTAFPRGGAVETIDLTAIAPVIQSNLHIQ